MGGGGYYLRPHWILLPEKKRLGIYLETHIETHEADKLGHV